MNENVMQIQQEFQYRVKPYFDIKAEIYKTNCSPQTIIYSDGSIKIFNNFNRKQQDLLDYADEIIANFLSIANEKVERLNRLTQSKTIHHD